MKIIVNPAYEHLRKFVESIPDIFESEGRVIYSGRNLIKVMTVDDGLEINIKRYGVPALVNRIAYSFFRAPKGRRAFSYPNILLQRGFETPVPIAYIEECKWGLIKYSYFISLHSSLHPKGKLSHPALQQNRQQPVPAVLPDKSYLCV